MDIDGDTASSCAISEWLPDMSVGALCGASGEAMRSTPIDFTWTNGNTAMYVCVHAQVLSRDMMT
jgi:hypothetical protein